MGDRQRKKDKERRAPSPRKSLPKPSQTLSSGLRISIMKICPNLIHQLVLHLIGEVTHNPIRDMILKITMPSKQSKGIPKIVKHQPIQRL